MRICGAGAERNIFGSATLQQITGVLHLWSYGAQHLTTALKGFSYRLRPGKLLVPKHKQINYDQDHNIEYFNEYRSTTH